MQRQIDRPVMSFGHDIYSMRDLLNGGCVILGRPGSGKTRFSGRHLALGLMRYPGSGGLILSASPTDLDDWKEIFAQAGRSNDLIVFGPDEKHTFNFINFLASQGADSREIAKAITTIGEAMDNDDTRTGGSGTDKFWPIKQRQTIETAVEIVRLAEGKVEIPKLHEFVINAPQSNAVLQGRGNLTDDEWAKHPAGIWQRQYHNQAFARAFYKNKTPREKADYDNAMKYWQAEWPASDPKTRSNIEAGVTGILHTFNSGLVRTLLSEGTTITPEVMENGKWVFVDMSAGQYGSTGAFVLNAWRYATQKYVLKRNPAKWVTPIGIWADEFGKVVNSNDMFYLTESRKFGGYTVALAQSMQSFHAALPGQRGAAQAEVLLGCFSTKVLHAIGDPGTAEWAAKTRGHELKIHYSFHPRPEQHPWKILMGHGELSVSGGQSLGWVIEPRCFSHGLRCGEPPECVADAWVLKTGTPFSDGRSYKLVTFPLV